MMTIQTRPRRSGCVTLSKDILLTNASVNSYRLRLLRWLMAALVLIWLTVPITVSAGDSSEGVKLNRWNIMPGQPSAETKSSADEDSKDGPGEDTLKKEQGTGPGPAGEPDDAPESSVSGPDSVKDGSGPQTAPPASWTDTTKPLQSGDKPEPSPLGNTPEDRPWIIKQPPMKKGPTPPERSLNLVFQDKAQQYQCNDYLAEIKENYLKARYYSIQGDGCATAGFAKNFLALVEKCQKSCPENFLAANGYDDDFIINMKKLNELGKRRCLGGGK